MNELKWEQVHLLTYWTYPLFLSFSFLTFARLQEPLHFGKVSVKSGVFQFRGIGFHRDFVLLTLKDSRQLPAVCPIMASPEGEPARLPLRPVVRVANIIDS